jgi:hypothetical protein
VIRSGWDLAASVLFAVACLGVVVLVAVVIGGAF